MTYGELEKKVRNCEGYKIRNEWKHITYSKDIFIDNYYSLKNTLEIYEDSIFRIKDKKEEIQKFYRLMNKDLHNFVSSSSSLICHARRITTNLYQDRTEMQKVYDSLKNKAFVKDELCVFINDLRNYVLHYSIPIKGLNFSTDLMKGLKSNIMFDYKALMEDTNWKSLSKKILNQIKADEISIKDIVDKYFEKVTSFYEKLEGYQENYFRTEFLEYERLRNLYNKYMKPNIAKAIKDGHFKEEEIYKFLL